MQKDQALRGWLFEARLDTTQARKANPALNTPSGLTITVSNIAMRLPCGHMAEKQLHETKLEHRMLALGWTFFLEHDTITLQQSTCTEYYISPFSVQSQQIRKERERERISLVHSASIGL